MTQMTPIQPQQVEQKAQVNNTEAISKSATSYTQLSASSVETNEAESCLSKAWSGLSGILASIAQFFKNLFTCNFGAIFESTSAAPPAQTPNNASQNRANTAGGTTIDPSQATSSSHLTQDPASLASISPDTSRHPAATMASLITTSAPTGITSATTIQTTTPVQPTAPSTPSRASTVTQTNSAQPLQTPSTQPTASAPTTPAPSLVSPTSIAIATTQPLPVTQTITPQLLQTAPPTQPTPSTTTTQRKPAPTQSPAASAPSITAQSDVKNRAALTQFVTESVNECFEGGKSVDESVYLSKTQKYACTVYLKPLQKSQLFDHSVIVPFHIENGRVLELDRVVQKLQESNQKNFDLFFSFAGKTNQQHTHMYDNYVYCCRLQEGATYTFTGKKFLDVHTNTRLEHLFNPCSTATRALSDSSKKELLAWLDAPSSPSATTTNIVTTTTTQATTAPSTVATTPVVPAPSTQPNKSVIIDMFNDVTSNCFEGGTYAYANEKWPAHLDKGKTYFCIVNAVPKDARRADIISFLMQNGTILKKEAVLEKLKNIQEPMNTDVHFRFIGNNIDAPPSSVPNYFQYSFGWFVVDGKLGKRSDSLDKTSVGLDGLFRLRSPVTEEIKRELTALVKQHLD